MQKHRNGLEGGPTEISDIEREYAPAERDASRQVTPQVIRDLARECGFDLAGVAAPSPVPDYDRYRSWVERGLAGEMRYLTDYRADVRGDVERLLPGVKSVITLGFLYSGPEPHSTELTDPAHGWISRYAWGDDYHDTLRVKLNEFGSKLEKIKPCSWRGVVDTAPLLERSFGRLAGLGWIGKNTCLINQQAGSWFFLAEILTTLEIQPDVPPPDRCGTCTRCIEACPTDALRPSEAGNYELDANRCISYLTIELRSLIPDETGRLTGNHVFGCDICQDVCPWNRRADTESSFLRPGLLSPPLQDLAALTQDEFNQLVQGTPLKRSKYRGFLRNVANAMGNSGKPELREPLLRLSASEDELVAEQARRALARLERTINGDGL